MKTRWFLQALGAASRVRAFFIPAYATTIAVAGVMASMGSLCSNAQAAKRVVAINAPSGGPIRLVKANGKVMSLKPTILATPMFTATLVELGPRLVRSRSSGLPAVDDLRPVITLASAQGAWSEYMHDGYELNINLGPLKFTPGARASEPIAYVIPVPTRHFKPGGNMGPVGGVRQFDFFPDSYSSVAFFKDFDDPVTAAMIKALPDKGANWRTRPQPQPWKSAPIGSHQSLDRDKDARHGKGFTLYLGQMGPKGWGTELDYYDPSKYVMVMELEANEAIPSNWHIGWSAIGVIDGSVAISDVPSTSGSLVIFEPLARHILKAGPAGSTIVIFFDSGRATFPVWDSPDDPRALEFTKILRVPS